VILNRCAGNGFVVPEAKPATTMVVATEPSTTTVPTSTGPAPVKVDPAASSSAPFRFLAANLAGGPDVDGEQLFAKAPLVMTFVTPWCPVCIQEGPLLAATIKSHPEITYVFVHASGSAADYQAFIDSAGLVGANVLHIDDTDGAVWRRFNVASQPAFVLVDRKGLMRDSTGALDEAGLAKAAALVDDGIV
jgi:thiol-disulfide isomerase/thioredoxin